MYDSYLPPSQNPYISKYDTGALMDNLAQKSYERSVTGYSQALGKGPSPASIAMGFAAGALTAKLIFDILDR